MAESQLAGPSYRNYGYGEGNEGVKVRALQHTISESHRLTAITETLARNELSRVCRDILGDAQLRTTFEGYQSDYVQKPRWRCV